jgi:hypothetical protein
MAGRIGTRPSGLGAPFYSRALRLAAGASIVLAFCASCREAQEGGPVRVAADGGSELDSDPTSCDELTCDPPAQCEVSEGRARCLCPSGYTGEAGGPCQDVDECATADRNDCGDNARCDNRAGSYECSCNAGFSGDGRTCTSLSDCSADANTCHSDAICTSASTNDGVSCRCGDGFEGDGELCADVDECESGAAECAQDARCSNRRGGYACACRDGYEGEGRDQCRSACELALTDASRCDDGARCTLGTAADALCTSCLPGYVGDGKSCTSDSACAALGCGDNTVCSGSAGERRCECAPGFSGDPEEGCEDIDECEGSNLCASPASTCVNVPGGYVCECAAGFEREDGKCVNIDECARDIDLCDPTAVCTDTSPGFECACKPGYTGDGRACSDIDECAMMGEGACPQGNALVSCHNTRGSYECRCPAGYAGDPEKGCYCDLSGYWALRQDGTLTVPEDAAGDVVLLARTTTRVSLWELKRYRYDGETLRVETQQCGGDRGPEVYSPHYEELYSSGIPNATYDKAGLESSADIRLPSDRARPGETFNTPRHAAVYGIDLDDPLNDPWPTVYTEVPADRWVDSDDDGEPGVSLWPVTTTTRTGRGDETYDYLPVTLQGTSTLIQTRAGCISVALRNINHLEGRIDGCGRITGRTITDKIEARIHSCSQLRKDEWESAEIRCTSDYWRTARKCSEEQVKFVDEQDQTIESSGTFELVKLDSLDAEGINCESVRQRLPALPR